MHNHRGASYQEMQIKKERTGKSVNDNKKAVLLKDEYILLQKLYEDFDNKGLTIKNWAITVALTIIGASILYDNKNLLWLGMAAALIFWYLEGYWRGLAHFLGVRIQDIEKGFRENALQGEIPLQIYSTWDREFKLIKDQTFAHMFKRPAFLPHALIPFFYLILYFVIWK
jgi:hypothetical protein